MAEEYDDEEIILADLPDDELVEQMHDDLYDGMPIWLFPITGDLGEKFIGRNTSRRR